MIRPDDGAGAGDGKDLTVEECLTSALERLRSGKLEGMKKCLVIFLDDDNGKYHTAISSNDMKRSEIVSLTEVIKASMVKTLLGGKPPK